MSLAGAQVATLPGAYLPFVDRAEIAGTVNSPLGSLSFRGVAYHDTSIKTSIAFEARSCDGWHEAMGLAVSCIDPSFRGGTVRRSGAVVYVHGSLTGSVRRELLDACAQASLLDLSGVKHAAVDGIALCLIARERFGIQIARCSDEVSWCMRGWTNQQCETFCTMHGFGRNHCARVAARHMAALSSEVAPCA